MKKWHYYALIIIVLIIFGIGAFKLKFLPDPYHEEDAVTLVEWVQREIEEFRHGERG